MTTITVSNATELNAALRNAHSGDTFLLREGAYGDVAIRNLNVGGTVTLTSADPAHQATLTDLQISGSSGIVVKNLDVSVTTTSTKDGAIGVFQSTNVHFDHLNVHGSMNGTPTGDTDGFRIKSSTDVSVTNSEFQQLRIAIGHGDSTNLNFSGNYIHDIGMDGIHGGGSSNVTIANNYFTNFYQPTGVHADAIQFYTGNIVKLVHDITITGNVISQGAGQEIQGIFMRNEEAAGEFRTVKVSDNLVLGGNSNAIAVSDAHDLQITNNTVASRSGQLSWINVEKDDGTVVVTGNNAAKFNFDPNTHMTAAGNQLNISTTDNGLTVLREWLASHTAIQSLLPKAGELVTPQGFQALPVLDSMTTSQSTTLSMASHNLTLTGVLNADGMGNAMANYLVGNGGDNHLFGMDGNDTLEGGNGNDVLDGGTGIDTVTYEHSGAGVVVALMRSSGGSASGITQATGGAGKDTLIDIENLTGSSYADTLTGDTGANKLVGGAGDDQFDGNAGADTIDAGAGADWISAGAGADTIMAGAGADTIMGGAGGDRLSGGEGADRFVFSTLDDSIVALAGRDTITDFASGDMIDLKKLDAIMGGANDTFKLVNAFTHVAGQLVVVHEGDHFVVQGDVTGDGVADFAINVFTTKSALVAGDFLL